MSKYLYSNTHCAHIFFFHYIFLHYFSRAIGIFSQRLPRFKLLLLFTWKFFTAHFLFRVFYHFHLLFNLPRFYAFAPLIQRRFSSSIILVPFHHKSVPLEPSFLHFFGKFLLPIYLLLFLNQYSGFFLCFRRPFPPLFYITMAFALLLYTQVNLKLLCHIRYTIFIKIYQELFYTPCLHLH